MLFRSFFFEGHYRRGSPYGVFSIIKKEARTESIKRITSRGLEGKEGIHDLKI